MRRGQHRSNHRNMPQPKPHKMYATWMRAVNRQPWFPREGCRYGWPARNLRCHFGFLSKSVKFCQNLTKSHRICQKIMFYLEGLILFQKQTYFKKFHMNWIYLISLLYEWRKLWNENWWIFITPVFLIYVGLNNVKKCLNNLDIKCVTYIVKIILKNRS